MGKGVSLRDVMYDLFFCNGEENGGTNRGCGSKMHTYSPEVGIVGRNGVFGTRFTFSAGLAYASTVRNDGKVALCMYGEAEGSRAQYFEAMNMAVLWKLPVVFVAEHNGFSVDSRTEDMYALNSMVKLWRGFEIPVKQFDGNNLCEVVAVVSEAIERARAGEGPSVLEGMTYRIMPHSPLDLNHLQYRTQDEIEEWKKKDPIDSARAYLIGQGELTAQEDEALRRAIQTEIETIYAEAMAVPELVAANEVYNRVYYGIPQAAIEL